MNAFPITIRPEFVVICEGDHCAAAILDLFERWTYGKQKHGSSAPWIYKKRTELKADLMDMFGLNRVSSALLKLRAWGYFKSRTNPQNGQDKTLQYQVDRVAVNEILALLCQSPDALNESSERLNLNAETPDSTLSLTESESDSFSIDLADLTPATPARVSQPVAAAVQISIPSGEFIEVQTTSLDAMEIRDEHETHAFTGTSAARDHKTLPPVPRTPFPSDIPTEEETESVDRTPAVDIPKAVYDFFPDCAPGEVEAMVDTYGLDVVEAAIQLAKDKHGRRQIDNPPGFVRAQLGKGWRPVAVALKSYAGGDFADFVVS